MGWMSATVSTSMSFFISSSLISSVSARIDTKNKEEVLFKCTLKTFVWRVRCQVNTPCTTTSGLGMVEKRRLRGSISPGARSPLKAEKCRNAAI